MNLGGTNSVGGRRPNYAIIRLPEGTNVLAFYKLLLENGFPEVSFVNEVRENAFLPLLAVANKEDAVIANGGINAGRVGFGMDSGSRTASGKAAGEISSSSRAAFASRRAANGQSPSAQPAPSYAPPSTSISTANNIITQTIRPRTALIPAAPTPQASRPHNQQQQQQNGSSSSSSSSSVAPCPSPSASATQQLQQKNEEYAVCLQCNNRIMSSRLSNLTNHVRRHASMKQYRCCHCHYGHNEMAKVRLHMSHNHRDFSSQPLDMLSFEMQIQWGLLMEQCFPDHSRRFGPSAANSQFRCLDELQKYVDLDRPYTCIECGEVVQGFRLVNHLEDTHKQECVPSACGECGYQSNSQWKVRLHISVRHPERAADILVENREPGSNFILFLHKFFSEVHIPGQEEEEAKLVAELREKNMGQVQLQTEAIERQEEEEEQGKEQGEDGDGTSQPSQRAMVKEEKEMAGQEDKDREPEGKADQQGESGKGGSGPEKAAEQQQADGANGSNVGEEADEDTGERAKPQLKLYVRKRECLAMGEVDQGPMTKRHSLRQSSRLLQQQQTDKVGSSRSGIGPTLRRK